MKPLLTSGIFRNTTARTSSSTIPVPTARHGTLRRSSPSAQAMARSPIMPAMAGIESGMVVVSCLCAEWCDTCLEYRRGFFELAKKFPAAQFRWIDIEDQADEVGEI